MKMSRAELEFVELYLNVLQQHKFKGGILMKNLVSKITDSQVKEPVAFADKLVW
jgi:hypothetical protein